ncbi:MAG: nucleotidyltransferase [Elusimicrobia bacterium RIFOXYD2_FULL_34_15]|nr:MAG: nucleotidyltransferase [Elusimicrobia bacterium RIFOXYD2_FULL_34_15]
MKSLKQTKEILKKYKPILKSKYGVKEIGIFGSYARGEASKKSDIDILVNFSRPIGLAFVNLSFYLNKILHKKVDLVTNRALKPQLKDKILKEVVFI